MNGDSKFAGLTRSARLGRPRLGAPGFDHAERTCQPYETRATEFSRRQQRLPLRLRPLATSVRPDQHHEVEELAHVRRVSRRDNRFEDEEPRIRLRSRVNVPEELHALVVFPVVQDVLEQVTIGAGWHAVRKYESLLALLWQIYLHYRRD
jgi:hypothetical protein